MTYRATWNGAVLAESDDVVRLEGTLYFPAEAVNREHLVESNSHTVCPWKGLASYYTVVVGDRVNPDAAWHYPHPSPLARKIRNRVAFWRGVRVEHVGDDTRDRETAGLATRLRRWFS